MSFTNRISELLQKLASTYASGATTEQNTSYVDVSKFHRIFVELSVINVGTSLDMDIEVATDTDGGNLATLKSITQLTEAGGDDGSTVVVEIRAEELNIAGVHHRYLRAEQTPNGAGTWVCHIWGAEPRYAPVPTTALDEVVD